MFARGVAYLHAAHLPALKSLAAKPCVSITSKLIENKRLQVLYSGHLRKTGGRGRNQQINIVAEPQSCHSIGKSAGIKDQRYIGESGTGRCRLASRCNLDEPCASTGKKRRNRLECAVSFFPLRHP